MLRASDDDVRSPIDNQLHTLTTLQCVASAVVAFHVLTLFFIFFSPISYPLLGTIIFQFSHAKIQKIFDICKKRINILRKKGEENEKL